MLEINDIKTLATLGKIYPVKIEIRNGEKNFWFPKNKEFTRQWSWIKEAEQVSPDKIASVLNQYEIALILNDNYAVLDCDDSDAWKYVFNLLDGLGIDPVCEKSLSYTPENQKHHFFFKTDKKIPYCTKFADIGYSGNGELLGAGHLIFINKNGWYLNPSECTFPELPEIHIKSAGVSLCNPNNIGLIIGNGERNQRLTSIAGSLRRKGISENNIKRCLFICNEQCEPMLLDREIELISRSISRYEPQPINDFTELKIKMRGAV